MRSGRNYRKKKRIEKNEMAEVLKKQAGSIDSLSVSEKETLYTLIDGKF